MRLRKTLVFFAFPSLDHAISYSLRQSLKKLPPFFNTIRHFSAQSTIFAHKRHHFRVHTNNFPLALLFFYKFRHFSTHSAISPRATISAHTPPFFYTIRHFSPHTVIPYTSSSFPRTPSSRVSAEGSMLAKELPLRRKHP